MSVHNDDDKVQLNVRITAELRRRVGIVAEAREESLDKFVADVLNKRTKAHKPDTDSIVGRERKVL
jgi:hypothetical protein